ncbi:MAG: sigma-70 family RNA polymerase sigma factor [Phycisphaerae bacterium]|nr:sigma-70 family RNA polymerase sigma factor [Phycisphaerae bacterium]
MKTAISIDSAEAEAVPVEVTHKPTAALLAQLTDDEAAHYRQIPVKIDCMPNVIFPAAATEAKLYGEASAAIDVPNWTHFPEVAEDVVFNKGKRNVLSAADEVTLFLKYNYARYRLGKLIEAQARRVAAARARQMILWYRRAMAARADLVRANMALVLSMAKRTRIPNVEFAELVSEGNMALLRSVEKFDVARGFKFSTYACRAILKSFNRMATKTGRYKQHFPTEYDPELERSDYDVHKHEIQWDDSLEALREILVRNRANLSDIERTVVMERFALVSRGKGRTLAEVGKLVGLTNERVRQIQNLALGKIRATMNEQYLLK